MTKFVVTSKQRRATIKALAAAPIVASASISTQSAPAEKVLRYAFEVSETGFDPAQLSDCA